MQAKIRSTIIALVVAFSFAGTMAAPAAQAMSANCEKLWAAWNFWDMQTTHAIWAHNYEGAQFFNRLASAASSRFVRADCGSL